MRIQAHHSLFGDYEYLLVQHPGLWDDIENVLAMVNATGKGWPETPQNQRPARFSSTAIAETAFTRFTGLGWTPIRDGLAEGHHVMKERVVVELDFDQSPGTEVAFRSRHLALYADDVIDVAVSLMPIRDFLSSWSSHALDYEDALDSLRRYERRAPAVPLVLVGVAP
jgi:hypothetical protein